MNRLHEERLIRRDGAMTGMNPIHLQAQDLHFHRELHRVIQRRSEVIFRCKYCVERDMI